jgi:hypothetical protein
VKSTPRRERWLISGLAAAALAASALASPALSASASAEKPAKLEDIPGSKLKRVVLTAKAAERLGIETGPVRQEPVLRWMIVGGEVEGMSVEPVAAAGQPAAVQSAPPAPKTPVRVRVPILDDKNEIGKAALVLSLGTEDDDDDDDDRPANEDDKGRGRDPGVKSKSIMVVPIGGDNRTGALEAKPIKVAGLDNKAQYYEVDSAGYTLRPGQQVYVRVPQPGSGEPQTVIPYSAVIYDAQGNTWAYTNPEPLVFVRIPINVEYIEGNLAALKDGPAVGTSVVTVGAAELMGVEQKFGQ